MVNDLIRLKMFCNGSNKRHLTQMDVHTHKHTQLTMNMERKLLRSVKSSSTEVFLGSMEKKCTMLWYWASMFLCITTSLAYCSRACLAKL